MKNILLPVALMLHLTVLSQYYYTDLVDARLINDRMKNLTAQKVKSITATGYDAAGSRTSDFSERQEVDGEKKSLTITSRNGQRINRQYYQFDNDYRLTSVTDSSDGIKTVTSYAYDINGNITSIKTAVKDDSLQAFSETIEHQYQYNPAGKPERLLRILNGKDSSEYRFTLEEHKNVADEQLFRRGVGYDRVYYYYDDKNRLTDVVRYNRKAQKLLPTMMFEYDDTGRIIQKLTVVSADNPDYLIWRYLYDAKGLKTKEALFNKNKELTGRIEYTYAF